MWFTKKKTDKKTSKTDKKTSKTAGFTKRILKESVQYDTQKNIMNIIKKMSNRYKKREFRSFSDARNSRTKKEVAQKCEEMRKNWNAVQEEWGFNDDDVTRIKKYFIAEIAVSSVLFCFSAYILFVSQNIFAMISAIEMMLVMSALIVARYYKYTILKKRQFVKFIDFINNFFQFRNEF